MHPLLQTFAGTEKKIAFNGEVLSEGDRIFKTCPHYLPEKIAEIQETLVPGSSLVVPRTISSVLITSVKAFLPESG